MLMRHSMALDNLSKIIPSIDPDQKVALLHSPFKGTTLFGGELAKLHRANKERASSVTVYLAATPPSLTQAMVDLSGKVAPPTGRVAGIETGFVPVLEILEKSLRGLKKFQGPGKRLKTLKIQFDLLKFWKSA